ncbi:MAG: [protein-PII] uridylyltransferase [Gammaproteobacteria bacterium]
MLNSATHQESTRDIDWADFDNRFKTTDNPIPLFRNTLSAARDILQARFEQKAPADVLVNQHAKTVDHLLTRAWSHFIGTAEEKIALVAVGGYGRAELHPGSDIDLLILLKGNQYQQYASAIQDFLTFLWDIGLEVGQSVRSIKECVTQAKQDITVVTNLMEARLLCGPEVLFERLQKKTGPDAIWPSRKFFKAKLAEQLQRHHRFGDSAYNLEPNIKENPGGLRDIQVIGWVAKRHFGATTLHGLVDHDFLTENELTQLLESQNFLWRIRIGLHLLTGRCEDRLLFDHQRSLAQQFGYRDDERRLGVEKFMKDYYRTVQLLNRLNEMLLQLFDEEILSSRQRAKIKKINRRFQSRNGFLEVAYPKVFEYYPFALLELFLLMAQHRELRGVRAETIRLVRDNCFRIDDDFRNDVRCQSLFMEIFRQPVGLTHELRRMNRYGVLAAYIPAFGNITGQMQHDLFHVYTVDEHTMFLVRNLRRFTVEEFSHEFPLCSKIIRKIPKQELLYLAAFFHDIAKGRGGDHSELGAEDAIAFCQRHGLSQYDTNIVAWLVRNHLIMSMTSQRKDISDPVVITDFAERVGSQEKLSYLYLLTVADIRATNPALWNSWKDALLMELYYATTRAFRRGLGNPIEVSEKIAEVKHEALAALKKNKLEPAVILEFWQSLDDDYFMRHSTNEIVWHTQAILTEKPENYPIILIREQTHRGGTELFVCAHDERYVFALITAGIERLGLNIIDARIMSSKKGYTLDTFILLENNGDVITDPRRREEIEEKLHSLLDKPTYENLLDQQPSHMMSRRLKHFPIPTEITFRSDPRNLFTIMEVVTRDEPGLLAKIARALVQCKVEILNAKITTFGERAEDIFYITNDNNEPIRTVDKLNTLRDTITELLES